MPLDIRSLGHRYARRAPWVLHDVDLTLPDGALVRVTGRNGAGKSTLLRLVAGVAAPIRGTINGAPDVIGYAPEAFPRGQPFTVRAYLRHMARLRGLGRQGARREVGRVTERLGMTELLGTSLRELSKGGGHKVGVAQALLVPSGLVVLDEPFSGLDGPARAALTAMVHDAVRDGGTVVYSGHGRAGPGLAGALRWRVADGRVRALDPGQTDAEDAADDDAAPEEIRLELNVPADEADRVERSLRARGYEPRRVAG